MDVCREQDRYSIIRDCLDEQGIDDGLEGYRLLVSIIDVLCSCEISVPDALHKVCVEYNLQLKQLQGRVRYALAYADNESLMKDPSISRFLQKTAKTVKKVEKTLVIGGNQDC